MVPPRKTNEAREQALARFTKKELTDLGLGRHLVGRVGRDGPELGFAVGQPALGCGVTTVDHVVRLLDRLAEEGLSVRHLDRPGFPKGQNWKVKDVTKLVKSAAASSLRSALLTYLQLDAKGYAKLGAGSLSDLCELHLGSWSIDADGLSALADGNWPMLERLVLGYVEAPAESLLALVDALPALVSLRIEGWTLIGHERPSVEDFATLIGDPRFSRIEAFELTDTVELPGDEVLAALVAATGLSLTALRLPSMRVAEGALTRFLETPLAKQLRVLRRLHIEPSNQGALAEVGLPCLDELECTVIAGCDAEAVARFMPESLQGLTLTAPADVATAVVSSSKGLHELTLTRGMGPDLEACVFSAIARSSSASSLVALRSDSVPNEALGALAAAPFDGLRNLHLATYEPWGDDAAIELTRAPWARSLYTLGLVRGRLGDAFAIALAEGAFEDLGTLDLPDNSIGKSGVMALAKSRGLPQLHTLNLAGGPSATYGGADFADFKLLADPKLHPHLQMLRLPQPSGNARQSKAIETHPSVFAIQTIGSGS